MKMAEFSRRSGTPVATLKYYIREGLLPPGKRTAANQADYAQEHLDRVALIRALREVAGLPVATIRETLDAIERPATDDTGPDHLGVALRALGEPLEIPDGETADYQRAADRIDDVLRGLGWSTAPDAPGRADLIRAVVAIDRQFPGGVSQATLRRYADVARHVAEFEIPETWDPSGAPTDALRYAVLGTVLFEPVILALRRLAHADRHRRLSAAVSRSPS
jgi:DNA-binding transcriptional MerR regulator